MKLEGVNRRFGDRDVLKDINLNFDKNGMVFILGASGSGKSTLLNVLGLLDDGYDGKIYYGEKSVSDEAQKTNIRRKHIAFIFQEYNLINSLTVKENVQTAVDISEGVLDEEVYSNIISMFKLNNLENRDVATLSGGEKQRVAIARALVRNNEIIFADEPTGNLDEENSDIIFNALKEVAKNHLVVIVSHNKEAAEKFADRIITIRVVLLRSVIPVINAWRSIVAVVHQSAADSFGRVIGTEFYKTYRLFAALRRDCPILSPVVHCKLIAELRKRKF